MTDYNESLWADPEFSENFAKSADGIILERGRLIGVLKSFYGHFLGDREHAEVLDLGCGDGTLTHELMKEYGNFSVTLLDGSEDMLAKARRLVHEGRRAKFINASFQELLGGKFDLPEYGFIFSSLAIHHLETEEKRELFAYVRDSLALGGYFLNIDVVLPPTEDLEGWYLETWREWVDEAGVEDGADIIGRYKGNQDNKPDTLQGQLDMLTRLGYREVDCYYKNGIFVVFGGRR